MRKVFLDGLPRIEKGTNVGKINWKESVGYKIKFVYDDIEGEIEIVDYKKENRKLKVKYNNIFDINNNDFANCKLGVVIGKFIKNYRYDKNDIIETKLGKIRILKQIKIKVGKRFLRGYKYECVIDKYISQIVEDHLIDGVGCPVCAGQKIMININDLWTTHPEVAKLLKCPERGCEISYGRMKKEIFICPNCGFEKSINVADVVRRGFSCSSCGDGVSYPNKFIRNFLDQLNEEYIPEYSPDWAGMRRYDNFLTNRNEIWEVHGLQHYKEADWYKWKGKSFEEEQQNDKIKKELAEQNGYKYIEIDARKSELEWIKNSIENLPEMQRYDLNKIDWLKCHEFACSSLIKIACDLWNSGIENTKDIGAIMKLSYGTIITYLKKGDKLGWCHYNSRKILKESGKNKNNIIKIVQLSKHGEFVDKWDSMTEVEKKLNISLSNISLVCKGKRKSAGGFKWMYLEDYNNQHLINII